jgi:hypothetical protein
MTIVLQQVRRFYKTSNATAMLQLHAPGIRKQAISGNQLAARNSNAFVQPICALVEHPKSIELAKEMTPCRKIGL